MSVRRSTFARVSRGAATLSAAALLMGAGVLTPANAASGVPFDPTVSASVNANSQLGETVPINVHLDAKAGEQWTNTGGSNDPVTVRIDAYGAYADGAVPPESPTPPPTETAASTQTFVASNGPGDYTFALSNFNYQVGNYTFVVSVLKVDGSNSTVIASDASTPFAAPNTTTKVAYTPTVVGYNDKGSYTVGDTVTSFLTTSGFNGEVHDITSTLYGPFATAPTQSATVPANAPVAGTTLNSTSSTSASTGADTLNRPGFYVWRHTIAAGTTSAAFTPDFATPGNVFEVASVTAVTPPPSGSGPATPPADAVVAVPVTTSPATSGATTSPAVGIDAGVGGATTTAFANCTEARAAGQENIPASSPYYAAKLDRDKDGIACESNGNDTAVGINGGFVQASSVDNTPFIAGGVAMILLALAGGATVLVRRKK